METINSFFISNETTIWPCTYQVVEKIVEYQEPKKVYLITQGLLF